jgi:glycosyltransferase involved in cell wall biosynthesis
MGNIIPAKTPTISVILPTHNRGHSIKRAIQSVLDQTYQNFELIIVDDGSKDNTEEIVKEYEDQRIRYIKHEINQGAGVARNTGLKSARGAYIAFQDSDDEWLPEKLQKQIEVYQRATADIGVVYTDMYRISEVGEMKYWKSPVIKKGQLINPKTLDYQTQGLGIQSTLIRRDCFNIVGLFDENLPRWIDLELFIRLSKYYEFICIRDPLVKYYATEGISSNLNNLNIARAYLIQKYSEEFKKNRKYLASQQYYISANMFRCRNYGQSITWMKKVITTYPLILIHPRIIRYNLGVILSKFISWHTKFQGTHRLSAELQKN